MRTVVMPVAVVLLGATVQAQSPALKTAIEQAKKVRAEAERVVTQTAEYKAFLETDKLVKQLEALAAEKPEPKK